MSNILTFGLFVSILFSGSISYAENWLNQLQDRSVQCRQQALQQGEGTIQAQKFGFRQCYNENLITSAIESCEVERYQNRCSSRADFVMQSFSCSDMNNIGLSSLAYCYCAAGAVCSKEARAHFTRLKADGIAIIENSSNLSVGGASEAGEECSEADEAENLCVQQDGTGKQVSGVEDCTVQGSSADVRVDEKTGRVKICTAYGDGTKAKWQSYEDCSQILDSSMQARCTAKETTGVDKAHDEREAREAKEAEEAAKKKFAAEDKNKDGQVSNKEFDEADTDGDGRISAEERARALEAQAANPEQISACNAAFSEATLCCENPMACLIGGGNERVGDNVNAGIALVMQGGQAYSGMQQQQGDMSGQPSTAMCDFMGKASTAGVGINMASAAVCMQKKVACNQACDGTSTGKCNHLNGSVAQSALQGLSMAMAGQIADRCQSLAASSNGLTPNDIDFLPDCSDPANSSNPNCNGECSGPDAASNPFCKTGGGGTNGSGSATSYAAHNADYGDNGSNFDSNPDMMDGIGNQENLGFAAEGTAQANAIQGGGGGGMAGGAGGASLGSEGGGGSGGPGHNTSVLKGLSGGGGYTGPSTSRMAVSSGGGGFSGYGRGAKKADNGIDLKQFLPGGKKDPRKRTVAGMKINVANQIGRKETNIFQTMSVKYRQMCKLKRMWDCPKLSRAMGK